MEKKIRGFGLKPPLKKNIEVISDGKNILGTGGGIFNLMNSTDEDNFLIFNPDTYWNLNYLQAVNKMCDMYFKHEMENCLLIVDKKKRYDLRLNDEFGLKENTLYNENKNYIDTGS